MDDQDYQNKLKELQIKYVDLREKQWNEKMESTEKIKNLNKELDDTKSKVRIP